MRYCINPKCVSRDNPDHAEECQACRMPLVTQKRYCAIKPLHPDGSALSEVFVVEDLQEGTKKILKTLISPNPIAQRLFEQEHKLLRTFRHPGIPRGEAAFSIPLDGEAASERFAVVVPWHHSNSPDPDFPQIAQTYWKGDVNSRTANAHDAVRVLLEAFEQNPQNRQALREILAHSGFRARGATGEISFVGSERREAASTLVKVVPSCPEPSASGKPSLRYQFIWVGYDKPCY